jgi:hypothetical protein
LQEKYEVVDYHIYDDRDCEYKESEKDIYSDLEEVEHLDYTRYSVVLTPIVEELAIECSLIILENITEPPYIDVEWTIESYIDIR